MYYIMGCYEMAYGSYDRNRSGRQDPWGIDSGERIGYQPLEVCKVAGKTYERPTRMRGCIEGEHSWTRHSDAPQHRDETLHLHSARQVAGRLRTTGCLIVLAGDCAGVP